MKRYVISILVITMLLCMVVGVSAESFSGARYIDLGAVKTFNGLSFELNAGTTGYGYVSYYDESQKKWTALGEPLDDYHKTVDNGRTARYLSISTTGSMVIHRTIVNPSAPMFDSNNNSYLLDDPTKPKVVFTTNTEVNHLEGKNYNAVCTVNPADSVVTVTSSDESIATASWSPSAITISCLKVGTAEITLTGKKTGYSDGILKINVTVVPEAPKEMDMQPVSDQNISYGETKEITLNVNPADANIEVLLSDYSIANATVTGNKITIEGKGIGTTLMQIKARKSGYLDKTINVNVNVGLAVITLEDLPNIKLTPGDVWEHILQVSPADAKIEMQLANDKVAQEYLSDGLKLRIAGVTTGTTLVTIKATKPGYGTATDTFTVEVMEKAEEIKIDEVFPKGNDISPTARIRITTNRVAESIVVTGEGIGPYVREGRNIMIPIKAKVGETATYNVVMTDTDGNEITASGSYNVVAGIAGTVDFGFIAQFAKDLVFKLFVEALRILKIALPLIALLYGAWYLIRLARKLVRISRY